MIRLTVAAALLLSAPALAAPAPDGIKDAWVRINPAPGRPAAGYFRFTNGPRADRLIGASTPGGRVELHTMTMDGGMMQMRKLDGLDVPAGATVEFKPGANHLMIFGLTTPPASLPLTLEFASGAKVSVNAPTRSPAAATAAPKPAMGHEGH